nr:FaeA/PapI family transcriptional regulator [uncultured Methanoregula sp.]
MGHAIYENTERINAIIGALDKAEDRKTQDVADRAGLARETALNYLLFLRRRQKVIRTIVTRRKGRCGITYLWRLAA